MSGIGAARADAPDDGLSRPDFLLFADVLASMVPILVPDIGTTNSWFVDSMDSGTWGGFDSTAAVDTDGAGADGNVSPNSTSFTSRCLVQINQYADV